MTEIVEVFLREIQQLNTLSRVLRNEAENHKQKARIFRKRSRKLTKILLTQATCIERRRLIWSLSKNSTFWETEVPHNSDVKFKEDFSVSRETFSYLVNRLHTMKKGETNFRRTISLEKRVAVALYALASSSEYRTIANLFGIGRTTVGEIVLDFCNAVCETFEEEYLSFYPPTQDKITEIVQGFETWGFPQTYGAVDGCHIEVGPPEENCTLVLLAAVDYRYLHNDLNNFISRCLHRYRFTSLHIGFSGRNDAYIFEKSQLKNQHQENQLFYDNYKVINGIRIPVLLIGSSEFQMYKFFMTPFLGTDLNPIEANFNIVLSRSRRVVENAFGQLKWRFRKIGKGLQVDINNAPIIIKACCILHNLLNDRNDDINMSWIADVCEEANLQSQHTTALENCDQTAVHTRNAIAKYLYKKELSSAK